MSKVKLSSRQEASNQVSATNIDNIVTSAFERYLRSFFETTGRRRQRLQQMLPAVAQYVADADFVPESDPTKTKLAIERLTERTQSSVPCIIIGDTSIELRKQGFGKSIGQSRVSQTVIAHHIGIFRGVTVPLLVVANSKSDCYSLSQALHVIFFDAVNFLTASILRSEDPNATWTIRLPQMIDGGNPAKDMQGGDNQMQVWSNTISVSAFFEDSFIASGESIDDPVTEVGPESIGFMFPEHARVGQVVTGTITGMPWQATVGLDNVNVASLRNTGQCEYTLTMRRPGTVTVRVMDGAANGLKDQGSSVQPNIVATHTITVTF
jgi:hypothetical protein